MLSPNVVEENERFTRLDHVGSHYAMHVCLDVQFFMHGLNICRDCKHVRFATREEPWKKGHVLTDII
jgi:hypothetical protein